MSTQPITVRKIEDERLGPFAEITEQQTHANPLMAVHKFMILAGCTTEGFNAKQAGLYFGLQLEELAEKFEAIASAEPDYLQRDLMNGAIATLKRFSDRFKQGFHQFAIQTADRAEMLDGDIDLAWVSLGAAFSTSTDTYSAFMEVARANLGKFPDNTVMLDGNGKVMKPQDWTAPDMSQYVETTEG